MSTQKETNGLKQQATEEELLKLTEMEGIEGGGDCRIACEKGCLLQKLNGEDSIKLPDDGELPDRPNK